MLAIFAALLCGAAALQPTWQSLNLPPPIVQALTSTDDYATPTAVQAETIPVALDGNDCLIHAQTGSGKTLAYLAPLFARVDASRQTTQAVVIVPTRELGLQVARVARRLASALPPAPDGKPVMVMSLLDGSSHRRQRAWAWAEPPHVVVGNAKSVHGMAANGGLRCADAVRYVVVDEVDAFLDPAKSDDRAALHAFLVGDLENGADGAGANREFRENRQTVFATASLEQPRHLAERLASMRWSKKAPSYVRVGAAEATPGSLSHFSAVVPDKGAKLAVLRKMLRDVKRSSTQFAAIVFFDERRPLQAIADKLEQADGVACAVLDGRDDLSSRKREVDAYVAGDVDVLLCTDLAARGLDAPRTTLVVQFDFPGDATAYLHRAGRAARLGRAGAVLTLLEAREAFALERLANYLRVDVDAVDVSRDGAARLVVDNRG
jgi:superfamily II DNA/RNA helicase